MATKVNGVPLPPVPEVYGIRLPPVSARLTAPNFTLAPRSAAAPAVPPPYGANAQATPGAGLEMEESEGAEGLFGDDDEEDDEEEDDDDEDEEMVDVAAVETNGNSPAGAKRKAESDEEEYD